MSICILWAEAIFVTGDGGTAAGLRSTGPMPMVLGRSKASSTRFGLVDKLPKPIEWLSDNGSPYTAGDTRALARYIGLVPCTTPIQSPQSNRMAFVKTIKWDYARVSAKPDAASVLRQHDFWFEHYNSVYPHKALGYCSPREFRKRFIERRPDDRGCGRR